MTKLLIESIRALRGLNPTKLLKVYDLILSLQEESTSPKANGRKPYLKARELLKNCKGSLSQDVLELRSEKP